MQLSDLYEQTVGDVTTDPAMAAEFLKWIFEPGDIVGIRDRKGVAWGTVATDRDLMTEHLPDALESLYENDTEAFFCVAPLKESRGYTRKGIRSGENKGTRVLYADIDVKSGGFAGREDALTWVDSLAVPPGCVVESGSGGLHLYWKAVQGLSQERWWAYLTSTLPEGVAVDRLVDATRVLRLPGSIRFMSDGRQKLVRATYRESHKLRRAEFAALTDEPFAALENVRQERKQASEDLTQGLIGTGWSALVQEDAINESLSWAEILEPHGWSLFRDCGDHVQWTRPGKTGEKSATTGYPEEDSAMSLLSWAPETRLDDLKDAGVRLTKFRVWLRLEHNDGIIEEN